MVLEMVLLILIAAGVFGYVLLPLLRGDREAETADVAHDDETAEEREPVVSDSRTVRDSL